MQSVQTYLRIHSVFLISFLSILISLRLPHCLNILSMISFTFIRRSTSQSLQVSFSSLRKMSSIFCRLKEQILHNSLELFFYFQQYFCLNTLLSLEDVFCYSYVPLYFCFIFSVISYCTMQTVNSELHIENIKIKPLILIFPIYSSHLGLSLLLITMHFH